jgi:hypothetical protein
MSRILLFLAAAFALTTLSLEAQAAGALPPHRYFVGSSAFVAANVVLAGRPDAPDFYQINVGYWLTDRDAISLEAITWKYIAPVGIPWGPSFNSPEERYPGYVREAGIGVAYQRFLWGNLYSAAHALPLVKQYVDEDGETIQRGFRLFLTGRAGYQLRLLRDRVFLEPSIAATYWPIDTNMPAAFQEKEGRWPNHFLFEPGLHFGVRF